MTVRSRIRKGTCKSRFADSQHVYMAVSVVFAQHLFGSPVQPQVLESICVRPMGH